MSRKKCTSSDREQFEARLRARRDQCPGNSTVRTAPFALLTSPVKTKPAPISRGRLVELELSEPLWLLLFLRSSLFLRSRFLLRCVLHRVILPLHQIKRYSSKRALSCPLYKVESMESQEKNEPRRERRPHIEALRPGPKSIKRRRVELF